MTTMTQKTTRVTEAQANLIDQFKGQPNIAAIVKAFAQQSQDFENAAFEVLLLTVIPLAVGVQLDGMGDIVGVEREGRTDAQYLVRIQAQILLNNSSGTIPELLQLAELLGASNITLTEVFPAKEDIDVDASLENGLEIGNVLGRAKAGGVGLTFTWYDSAIPFKFDTAGQGFDQGELGELVGF